MADHSESQPELSDTEKFHGAKLASELDPLTHADPDFAHEVGHDTEAMSAFERRESQKLHTDAAALSTEAKALSNAAEGRDENEHPIVKKVLERASTEKDQAANIATGQAERKTEQANLLADLVGALHLKIHQLETEVADIAEKIKSAESDDDRIKLEAKEAEKNAEIQSARYDIEALRTILDVNYTRTHTKEEELMIDRANDIVAIRDWRSNYPNFKKEYGDVG